MSDVIVTVGLDLAKNVFQVHGVDIDGRACLRRKLRRAEITPFFASLSPCLVGMEACASSHSGRARLPGSVTRSGSCRRLM